MTEVLDDPTDIDELMRRVDEEIEFGSGIVPARFIDAVVEYQRQQRAKRQAGVKTRKADVEGPKLDIKALLAKPMKMNRRI